MINHQSNGLLVSHNFRPTQNIIKLSLTRSQMIPGALGNSVDMGVATGSKAWESHDGATHGPSSHHGIHVTMVIPPWESKQNGSVNPMKIGMRWDEHERTDGKATHVWKNIWKHTWKNRKFGGTFNGTLLHDDPSFCSLPATNLQTRSLIPWERSQIMMFWLGRHKEGPAKARRLQKPLKSLKKLHKLPDFATAPWTHFLGLPRKRSRPRNHGFSVLSAALEGLWVLWLQSTSPEGNYFGKHCIYIFIYILDSIFYI